MTTRIVVLKELSPLADALPRARFRSRSGRVVAARPADCFDALLDLRWADLTVTGALMSVRALGRRGGTVLAPDAGPALATGPVVPLSVERPRYQAGCQIGRPWLPSGPSRPVESWEQVRAFREPGWLKYGMEFTFTGIGGGRTYVETQTLCEATDDAAAHRFAPYWALIKPFSDLIRLELLAAIGRRAVAA